MKDVELAEILIRVSLLLERELRHEGSTAPVQPACLYAAPAHRAVALDGTNAQFALAYSTQTDGPTQLDASALARQVVADGDDEDEDGDDDGEDDVNPVAAAPAAATGGVGARAAVLQFEDLQSGVDLFKEGFGTGGAHLLNNSTEELVIDDRRLMQKLFLTGKNALVVKTAGDLKFNPPGTVDNTNRKRCSYTCVAKLFRKFAENFPRLAVYDSHGSVLKPNR